MPCYVQHTCKKLNFHNRMKNTLTIEHTHTASCLLQMHETCQDMHI